MDTAWQKKNLRNSGCRSARKTPYRTTKGTKITKTEKGLTSDYEPPNAFLEQADIEIN